MIEEGSLRRTSKSTAACPKSKTLTPPQKKTYSNMRLLWGACTARFGARHGWVVEISFGT